VSHQVAGAICSCTRIMLTPHDNWLSAAGNGRGRIEVHRQAVERGRISASDQTILSNHPHGGIQGARCVWCKRIKAPIPCRRFRLPARQSGVSRVSLLLFRVSHICTAKNPIAAREIGSNNGNRNIICLAVETCSMSPVFLSFWWGLLYFLKCPWTSGSPPWQDAGRRTSRLLYFGITVRIFFVRTSIWPIIILAIYIYMSKLYPSYNKLSGGYKLVQQLIKYSI